MTRGRAVVWIPGLKTPASGTQLRWPARRDGRLVKGVDGGAVVCGERDVDGVTRAAAGDPEVRFAPRPNSAAETLGSIISL
jgi:hypothetical protein